MNCERTTVSLLFAATLVVGGCQTAPIPGSANSSTPQAEPAATVPTPAMSTPSTAPRADIESKAHEAAPEPVAKSMSTIELQQRLTELGYKPGPVDGKAGLRTTNALKKFQHDHKLPATGALDAETILELAKP